MQRLEVSGALGHIYASLGFKGLNCILRPPPKIHLNIHILSSSFIPLSLPAYFSLSFLPECSILFASIWTISENVWHFLLYYSSKQ